MTRKRNILTKIILLFFSAQSVQNQCSNTEKESFSYVGTSNGPGKWGRKFSTCNGKLQSPINIGNAGKDRRLEKLTLVNYGVPLTRAEIHNNGHTVEITPKDSVNRHIKVEGSIFKLRQLHFHWSKNQNDGTEHGFNHQKYSMEGHFVHSNDRGQTAVVAVLYRAVSGENSALQPIVDTLPYVRYLGERATIGANVNLNGLLPSNPSSFYRYKGSLTTPPCTEGVTWSVLKNVINVGKQQLSQFSELYAVTKRDANPKCKITINIRPLQPLNGRKVVESA